MAGQDRAAAVGPHAGEFEDLVRSGGYAAWAAANQKPALPDEALRVGGMFHFPLPSRNGKLRLAHHVRPAPAGRVARRRRLLPGPVPGR